MGSRIIKHLKSRDLFRTILKESLFYINSHTKDEKKYLEALGKYYLGYKFDLVNPKTFNEKINWIKLNVDRYYLSRFVDKVLVKEYVAEKIGSSHIIPTIAVYNNASEIDFDVLPKQFVMKCNHDSGSVVIIRDKDTTNFQQIRDFLQEKLDAEFADIYKEHAYEVVKRKIICESYLEQDNESKGLTDYKFYCFNGEPKFLYVSKGLENHATATISFYDMEMNLLPFYRSDYRPNTEKQDIPEKWTEMIDIARKLSKDFPFVRIDMYCVHGQVYFSEYTFTPCAGLMPFEPSEYDLIVGEQLDLSGFMCKKIN